MRQSKTSAHLTNTLLGVSVLICLATVKAVPAKNNDTITRFTNQVNTNGTYGFDIVQSSGLEYKEVGLGGQYAKGAFKYVSPEGKNISVAYTADETGFHPESEAIPTPPPIPAYILKAIKYIQDHPTIEEWADRRRRAKEI